MKALFGVKAVAFIVIAVGLLWYGGVYNEKLDREAAERAVNERQQVAEEQQKQMESLKTEDIVVGTGAEAKNGSTVSVHYMGTLADGTKFDSSRDRGKSFEFKLGAGDVIKGWDLGVVGMEVGGKRKLVVPPELAYGDRVVGPIPANSTLYFEVELLGVK